MRISQMLNKTTMKKAGAYFTVVIPWSNKPTKWHPTDKTGPFSILSRGAFKSEQEANKWAESNLNGQPYSVSKISTDF